MELAPVALFVYNRSWHTRQTVEALKRNSLASESDLIIFSDGPKDSPKSEKEVSAVREYLKKIDGFKSIKIIKREKNYGLANSIISGVGEIVDRYGRIIVIEDDLVTSPFFLKYMNESLELYATEDKVISVHGYIYPTSEKLPETFFLRGADCWGWATWKRGWDIFEPDGKKLLKELEEKRLTKEFDFFGSYPYTQMLRDQISGKNNSWAIRWYASAFLRNKLTLYPGKSLVDNIGLDGSGTHCSNDKGFINFDRTDDIKVVVDKISVKEDLKARHIVANFFKKQKNFLVRGKKFLKIILNYAFKD